MVMGGVVVEVERKRDELSGKTKARVDEKKTLTTNLLICNCCWCFVIFYIKSHQRNSTIPSIINKIYFAYYKTWRKNLIKIQSKIKLKSEAEYVINRKATHTQKNSFTPTKLECVPTI